MSVIDEAKAKIKGRGLKLVMPEGDDERIRAAAERFRREGLAEAIVFGPDDVPAATVAHVALVQARREKMSEAMAMRLLKKPLYRAGAAVAAGEAHAMLAGAANPTARVIEAALMTIGIVFFISRYQFNKYSVAQVQNLGTSTLLKCVVRDEWSGNGPTNNHGQI